MKNVTFPVFDLFAGHGSLSLSMEQTGSTLAFANEIWDDFGVRKMAFTLGSGFRSVFA